MHMSIHRTVHINLSLHRVEVRNLLRNIFLAIKNERHFLCIIVQNKYAHPAEVLYAYTFVE